MDWVSLLPGINASLNGLSSILLFSAWVFIRRGGKVTHRRLMLSALGSSALFLVSYTIYHSQSGMTKFLGTGWSRKAYFFILSTHVPLAAVVLPLAIVTVFFAFTGRFERHKKIAHWTFPIWLYVSITGVLVYFFLYHWFPSSRS